MQFKKEACYQAVKAQDARFDGLFYTAVKTTRIYCRPICKVPAPKYENCTFYNTAAEAEAAGYRPCLRCRPELAPGYADAEQYDALFEMAVRYFDKSGYQSGQVGAAAAELGVTPRHLNRVFKAAVGTGPQQYMMTKRLLTAKQLLSDTRLSIDVIAKRSGFGSASRLRAAMQKHYRLPPSAFRGRKRVDDALCVNLAYRPPYDWEAMMAFYKVRTLQHMEAVTDAGLYRRGLSIKSGERLYSDWIQLTPKPENCVLQLEVSDGLAPVLVDVVRNVRRAFDLDTAFMPPTSTLPVGIRLPGCLDGFEMAVRAVVGQQITVKAAMTLLSRLVDTYGIPVTTPWPEVTRCFPEPSAFCGEVEAPLGKLGIIKTRSRLIQVLSRDCVAGRLTFEDHLDPDALTRQLLAYKGIGNWTASYLVMRGMSWPDAFPVMDVGVINGLAPYLKDVDGQLLADKKEVLTKHQWRKRYIELAEHYAARYKPWRSYLTLALWSGTYRK